ncbi:hypothetical protein J6590_096018 [Homalodisca vitripennis]|nr:hypothetical protein J6590_096018 [Homalodisca vitripennis]
MAGGHARYYYFKMTSETPSMTGQVAICMGMIAQRSRTTLLLQDDFRNTIMAGGHARHYYFKMISETPSMDGQMATCMGMIAQRSRTTLLLQDDFRNTINGRAGGHLQGHDRSAVTHDIAWLCYFAITDAPA